MRVSEIAGILGGKPQGESAVEIRGVAGLAAAGPDELTYAVGARAVADAAGCRAGCILVAEGVSLPGHTTIAVPNPKLSFIRATALLRPEAPFPPGVHPTAVVAADARLAPEVSVGACTVIEGGASVGAGSRLGPGVVLGAGSQVGARCVLHARVTVYPGAKIGDRVILHSGVVVGSDGFGYVFAEGRHHKFPQIGQVVIEDDVEIGSNTTIDRGSLGRTVIGQGTKIDNLVQIAHNVKVGRHCVIAAQTGISGSVEIGDFVVMGGQVGIGDHVRIEDHVNIGGQAGILPGKILRKGSTVWGTPARPMEEFARVYANLSNLPTLAERVKELSRKLAGRRPEPKP